MKKIIYSIIAIALLSACSTTLPYAATNNPIGKKKGKSSTSIILPFGNHIVGSPQLAIGLFVTNKNFGVIEAAKKGKIETIATVDVNTTNFIFFQTMEIIVTGE